MTATPAATAWPSSVDVEAALDLERMTAVTRPLLAPLEVLAAAEVMDLKPGRRALVRYSLAERGSPASRTLLAKLYVDPVQAKRVHDLMRRLREVFASSPGLEVPRVLGWMSSPSLVLYEPAPGAGIDDQVDDQRLLAATSAAARWLAVLHSSGLRLDRRLDVAHETADAARWAERVARELPRAASAARAVAAGLEASSGLRLRTDVPIHKDFHHQHLVLGPAALAVVDLDEARLGDPTLDVAHFVANLELLAIRSERTGAVCRRVQDAFVEEYGRRTGWSVDERFAFFGRYALLKMAKQLAVGSGLRPRPAGVERERQAVRLLARAEEAPWRA